MFINVTTDYSFEPLRRVFFCHSDSNPKCIMLKRLPAFPAIIFAGKAGRREVKMSNYSINKIRLFFVSLWLIFLSGLIVNTGLIVKKNTLIKRCLIFK